MGVRPRGCSRSISGERRGAVITKIIKVSFCRRRSVTVSEDTAKAGGSERDLLSP